MIGRTVEAVVLDWESTGASLPSTSLAALSRQVEAMSAVYVDVAVLGAADVGAVDDRLRARPPGPGRLLICVGNDAELFEVGPDGPRLVRRPGAGPTMRWDALRDVLAILADRGSARDSCWSSATSSDRRTNARATCPVCRCAVAS